jgi:IS30 family transposase
MAGRATFDASYVDDITILRRRGVPADRIARQLGMSRATVYRLIKRYQEGISN